MGLAPGTLPGGVGKSILHQDIKLVGTDRSETASNSVRIEPCFAANPQKSAVKLKI